MGGELYTLVKTRKQGAPASAGHLFLVGIAFAVVTPVVTLAEKIQFVTPRYLVTY